MILVVMEGCEDIGPTPEDTTVVCVTQLEVLRRPIFFVL